jgi:uncharacterized protein
MEITGEAKLLRIFTGESGKVAHRPLHEVIVEKARAAGLAGATAWRAILGFGPSARVRTTELLDLSSDLPMVIEIVDEAAKINAFITRLNELFDAADCGGLMTIEKVEVIRYLHRPSAKGKRA